MIKRVVGRNITVLSKTELDNVRLKYGKIVNSSETLNGDEIDDVWKTNYLSEEGITYQKIKILP